MTPTQKLKRKVILKHYAEAIEAMYPPTQSATTKTTNQEPEDPRSLRFPEVRVFPKPEASQKVEGVLASGGSFEFRSLCE